MLSHFRFGLMGVVEPRFKRIVMPLDIMCIRLDSDKALPNTSATALRTSELPNFS
jgi:hypothetical protein